MDFVDLNGGRVCAANVYAVQIGGMKLIELLNGRLMLTGTNPREYTVVQDSEIANALAGILAEHLAERKRIEEA